MNDEEEEEHEECDPKVCIEEAAKLHQEEERAHSGNLKDDPTESGLPVQVRKPWKNLK